MAVLVCAYVILSRSESLRFWQTFPNIERAAISTLLALSTGILNFYLTHCHKLIFVIAAPV